jgi:Zn-dependent protease with chaperone function
MSQTLRQTFYQQQDQARAQTKKLLAIFFVVVAITIIATMAIIHFVMAVELKLRSPFPSAVDILGGALAGGVVLIGALIKRRQLKRGGQTLAHMMGGRVLLPNSIDHDERRLLNIVEEMAIAAGIAVPPVYVLDREPGINAFAAGLSPSDAVIAVSKGALTELTRDELQGVVAHEFSHIFNGDMKLNMDLLGWVAGLTAFTSIGRFLIDVSRGSSQSRSKQNREAAGGFILIGIALIIVGFFGTLMAGIVKAAISRQREFLADATAIQYTRNPHGIGGALTKILRSTYESIILSPVGKEASHFFFAPALSEHFYNFSTHPPIIERLKRISPDLIRDYVKTRGEKKLKPVSSSQLDNSSQAIDTIASLTATAATMAARLEPSPLQNPKPRTSVTPPQRLINMARSSNGAPILVAAILSIEAGEERENVERELASYAPSTEFSTRVADTTTTLLLLGEANAKALRFTLLELAMPSLRLLSHPDRIQFMQLAQRLVMANGHISLFEAAALIVVQRAMAPQLEKSPRLSSAELRFSISVLVSAIAHLDQDPNARFALAVAACRRSGLKADLTLIEAIGVNGQRLVSSLQRLRTCPPEFRRQLISALEDLVQSVPNTGIEENELLRATALALDLPLHS